MALWDRFKKKEKEEEKDVFSPEQVQRILAMYGLQTVDKDHVGFTSDKLDTVFPFAMAEALEDGMGSFWTRNAFNTETKGETGRSTRYKHYEFMANDSPELGLFHDTLVAEAMSYLLDTGKLAMLVVKDKNNQTDKELTDFLNKRLAETPFNEEAILEGMSQYGNKFQGLRFEATNKSTKVMLDTLYPDPRKVTIKAKGDFITPTGYKVVINGTPTAKHIFEMLNFQIPTSDSRYLPYGKSLFESARAPYKKLMILETLLALSRGSKVDKLVVSFPTGGNSPTDILHKSVRIRAMLKDLLYGSGTSIKTANKPLAFTDILLAPKGTNNEGFTFDRLPSGLDLATVDDVEYFLDKVIASTRMPRAFFKPDEAYQGYRKLALQDLRFARFVALVVNQIAMQYITWGSLVLALEKKKMPEDYTVSAEYKQIAPLASDQMDAMARGLDAVNTFGSIFRDVIGLQGGVPVPAIKELVSKFTVIPQDIIDKVFKFIAKAKKQELENPPDMGGGFGQPGVGGQPQAQPEESIMLNQKDLKVLSEMLSHEISSIASVGSSMQAVSAKPELIQEIIDAAKANIKTSVEG